MCCINVTILFLLHIYCVCVGLFVDINVIVACFPLEFIRECCFEICSWTVYGFNCAFPLSSSSSHSDNLSSFCISCSANFHVSCCFTLFLFSFSFSFRSYIRFILTFNSIIRRTQQNKCSVQKYQCYYQHIIIISSHQQVSYIFPALMLRKDLKWN